MVAAVLSSSQTLLLRSNEFGILPCIPPRGNIIDKCCREFWFLRCLEEYKTSKERGLLFVTKIRHTGRFIFISQVCSLQPPLQQYTIQHAHISHLFDIAHTYRGDNQVGKCSNIAHEPIIMGGRDQWGQRPVHCVNPGGQNRARKVDAGLP